MKIAEVLEMMKEAENLRPSYHLMSYQSDVVEVESGTKMDFTIPWPHPSSIENLWVGGTPVEKLGLTSLKIGGKEQLAVDWVPAQVVSGLHMLFEKSREPSQLAIEIKNAGEEKCRAMILLKWVEVRQNP